MRILFVADLRSREDRHLAIFTARAFSSEAASVSASSCSSSRLYRISGRRGLTRHHAELFTLTPARGGARWPELSGRWWSGPPTMVHELARSLEIADHILADSMATRNDIVKQFSIQSERISVVPLAASESFRPLPVEDTRRLLAEWGLVPDGYLLFMGTIEPRKNLLRLLQAVELAGSGIGPLVIVGADGWGSDEVARHIERLQRSGRLSYLGYVPDDTRPALINGARSFVYPSLYEGFGLPVLEAMACGVPVLASNVASLPEVVGDAGLLVNPCDVDAIAGGMVRLWQDEALRHELSQRGLERARGFSWAKTASQTLSAYARG